ncbi:MAG: hypothetical protein ACC656_00300, partial [Candidatus Heimdallarchaeota archaeon]
MGIICINCSGEIRPGYCNVCFKELPSEKEFCNSCCAKLDIMVDVSSDSRSNLVDTNADSLFQTRTVTGNIISDDDDIIANRQRNDDEGGDTYWMYVFIIVFFLV